MHHGPWSFRLLVIQVIPSPAWARNSFLPLHNNFVDLLLVLVLLLHFQFRRRLAASVATALTKSDTLVVLTATNLRGTFSKVPSVQHRFRRFEGAFHFHTPSTLGKKNSSKYRLDILTFGHTYYLKNQRGVGC